MKTLIAATALVIAAPVLAQAAPAPAPAPGAQGPRERVYMKHMYGQPMWANVSPEGRAILRETMRGDPRDREAIRASRDRINAIVGADRLDVGALRKAMDEERRLVDGQHARRQAAMLAAIQKLSPADRKAFAQDASRGRADVEARAAEWRKWGEQMRERMRDMPPPPPPPNPGTAIE